MALIVAKAVQASRFYRDDYQMLRNLKIETDDGMMEIVLPGLLWPEVEPSMVVNKEPVW